MRVAGAGAVGTYAGGRLAQTVVPVAFLARGDHLHAEDTPCWRLRAHLLRPDGEVTDDEAVLASEYDMECTPEGTSHAEPMA